MKKMQTEMMSWGECIVFEETACHKISKVLFYPKVYFFSQSPENGDIWILISAGVGCITSEGIVKNCQVGDSVIIPKGIRYTIKNPLDEFFEYIEVLHKIYVG
jgi:mannose-6-phosphate isomerase-like protein (cupin superfamily)